MKCINCSGPIGETVYAFGKNSPLCEACFVLLEDQAEKPKRGVLDQLKDAIPFLWRR